VTALFYPGNHESVKYAVHGGLFALASVCVAYNLGAYILRRERHLARNVVIYAALAGVELAQMERHR
jgi:hypothetical protein